MSSTPVCSCEALNHPRSVSNPPGRSSLVYRVGDYVSFRKALLISRPGEVELANWRPGAKGDLALQMMEWFAYLADILTFYNERIANQDYLRTADLPESVQRLIRVLGYRPRPGIGAIGTLAALLTGSKAVQVPRGFAIQSKPGPGKQPQIFEVDAAAQVQAPDAVAADPAPNPALLSSDGMSVMLAGAVTTLKTNDVVVLLSNSNSAVLKVSEVAAEKDPRGRTNTRVRFTSAPSLPAGAMAADYRILKSNQAAHLYPFQVDSDLVITSNDAQLETLIRGIKAGDPVVLEVPGKTVGPQVVAVSTYEELVWYANATDPSNPQTSPDPTKTVPVPIPHAHITFSPSLSGNASDWQNNKSAVVVRYGWQDAGTLISSPTGAFTTSAPSVSAEPGSVFPVGSAIPVLIEDANGNGAAATATVASTDRSSMQFANPPEQVNLTAPLKVLFNLLSVSRGKTVRGEVLGGGDATVAGQEFVLQNKPLTYLLSAASTSDGSYASTLRVWVEHVEWKEVPSFYGQPAGARIFVTREDENARTHVQFGDGVNGARLPSGTNNVIATYRYGSGANAPDAGSLSVILSPLPGLKAVRNPVAVGGGDDPDPPEQIKQYAPQSVLAFGRAISGNDYETIAAQAPGVALARSYYSWDSTQQRATAIVYVGDDASALNAAKVALAGAIDPNRPAVVQQAKKIAVLVNLTLLVDPAFDGDSVKAAAGEALLDPQKGLFSSKILRIGQSIYDSQIDAACLSVPGALALQSLQFSADDGVGNFVLDAGFRHSPGEGGFFTLSPDQLQINWEAASYAV
jgi:predicted phage baseplate assembly protein